MSLITKEHLSLTLQSIKKLLSYKADKDKVAELATELSKKVDKNEIATDDDALDLLMEYKLVAPISDSSGRIFINGEEEIYIL